MSRAAFDDALQAELPALRRYARWLARDASAADDLVQSTLEKALRQAASQRDPEALRAWLFAILYREFIDAQRRVKRFAWLLDRLGLDTREQPSVERDVEARSTLEAFAALPVEQRNLLYWVSIEGLSYRQAAELLDVPIGTVMSRLSRARAALRRLSDGDGQHGPPPPLRVHK